jgi:hypothetical protein
MTSDPKETKPEDHGHHRCVNEICESIFFMVKEIHRMWVEFELRCDQVTGAADHALCDVENRLGDLFTAVQDMAEQAQSIAERYPNEEDADNGY